MLPVVVLSAPCGKFPCKCIMKIVSELNKNVKPNTITTFHYHGKYLVLIEVNELTQ